MQYFAVPSITPQTLDDSRRQRTHRKRKRQDEEETQDASATEPGHASDSAALSLKPSGDQTSAITSLKAATVSQFRAAGHALEDAVPPYPFPHAPVDSVSNKRKGRAQVRVEFAEPIGCDGLETDPFFARTRRQQHLGVATTVMHRCLLRGDFERAGRAFGMILRSKSFRVRKHGHWGIGAEILLHNGDKKPANLSPISPLLGNGRPSEIIPRKTLSDWFSREGFDKAKAYYERLILQYPPRQSKSGAVDSRTFYPAMFTLWILEVHQCSRRCRDQFDQGRTPKPALDTSPLKNSDAMSSSSVSETEMDEDEDEEPFEAARVTEDQRCLAEELGGARDIAARLDDLFLSPPYDRHAELLQIRARVSLWIADLLKAANAQSFHGQVSSLKRGQVGSNTITQFSNAFEQFDEDLHRDEIRKAEDYFQRAKECSANGHQE